MVIQSKLNIQVNFTFVRMRIREYRENQTE